ANQTLARRIDELAAKVDEHDRAFAVVFHELRQLVTEEPGPEKSRERIGFKPNKKRGTSGKGESPED
ncbi:MAG: hypothetical protein LBT97_11235, partial [Planctomycetota bacterium]|nr:hypothetical protein [Planctomycetota bacterium]